MKRSLVLMLLLVALLIMTACSHPLKVKNLEMYNTPTKITRVEQKPLIAILPFSGQSDDIFYFNALVSKLSLSPSIKDVYTDYKWNNEGSADDDIDIVLSIRPSVSYRSSGWNFIINWPGFLIFTPAWNGYVYYADILTHTDIYDNKGNIIDQFETPITYDIRQAEFDRTVFTGITWLEVSALAFVGGIYNVTTFDRDIIGTLQNHVKDNYANNVSNKIISKACSSYRSLHQSSKTP